MGLALGLGMLTKMTFYLYAFPVLVFFCVRSLMVAHQRGKAIVELILIGTMAALLNLGYWSRNFITFGSVFGSREYIAYRIISLGPGALLGGLARNLAQNLAMPNEQVTASMVNGLKRAFAPVDPTMKIFDLEFAWNHENLAGNPVHLMLAFSAFVIVFLRKQLRANRLLCTYLLLTIASYLTLGYGIYDFFGVRFQLPAFIAWAVPFGIVSESLVERSRVWPVAMTLLLFLMALPWLLFNRTRPVIAMRDSSDPLTIPCLAGCTAESVLIAPPTRVMFAGKLVLEEPYVQATNALKETGCRSVGLYLDSHDLEYLFWWLLEAPQSGIRLETLHAVPETERYLDPAYQPCAVLCTLCHQGNQIQDQFYGLGLVGDYSGRVQLYVDKRYRP
jgi:ABC-type proline/glycine betaine transport system permease subunit